MSDIDVIERPPVFEKQVAVKPKSKKPKKYDVLLINPNQDPNPCVACALTKIFAKSANESYSIQSEAYSLGVAEVQRGLSHEIAETKADNANDFLTHQACFGGNGAMFVVQEVK